MPTYVYKCKNGHVKDIAHAPGAVVVSYCERCGLKLRRVFTAPNVKRSSFIEPSPAVKQHLNDLPRLRDEMNGGTMAEIKYRVKKPFKYGERQYRTGEEWEPAGGKFDEEIKRTLVRAVETSPKGKRKAGIMKQEEVIRE